MHYNQTTLGVVEDGENVKIVDTVVPDVVGILEKVHRISRKKIT